MKKIILSLLYIAFISTPNKAQLADLTIAWGPSIKVKKSLLVDIVSAQDNTIYATLRQKVGLLNYNYIFQKYEDLEPEESLELTSDRAGRTYTHQSVMEIKDHLYVVNNNSSRTLKSATAQLIDAEALQLEGEEISLYEFKEKRKLKYAYGDLWSSISRNENYLAYTIEKPGTATEKSELDITVYDDYLEEAWFQEIGLPYTRELAIVYSTVVTDNGNLFVCLKVYKDKIKTKKKGKRNYSFYVLSITKDGLQKKTQLSLKDKYISSIKLDVNEAGDLMCGGFYGDRPFAEDGVFYLKLNGQNFSKEIENYKEFSTDFITQGLSERKKAKVKRKEDKGRNISLNNVVFRDFILKENGGALLLGEYYDVVVTTRTDANGNTSTTSHYYYNSIYAISVDAKGSIEWAKKIQKYQHSTNDGGYYSSFFVAINKDKVYIMFNDSELNADKTKENDLIRSYVRNPKISALMLVTLNNDGTHTREVMVEPEGKKGGIIRPKVCRQVDDGSVVLFSLAKKTNRFARVTFNE